MDLTKCNISISYTSYTMVDYTAIHCGILYNCIQYDKRILDYVVVNAILLLVRAFSKCFISRCNTLYSVCDFFNNYCVWWLKTPSPISTLSRHVNTFESLDINV